MAACAKCSRWAGHVVRTLVTERLGPFGGAASRRAGRRVFAGDGHGDRSRWFAGWNGWARNRICSYVHYQIAGPILSSIFGQGGFCSERRCWLA